MLSLVSCVSFDTKARERGYIKESEVIAPEVKLKKYTRPEIPKIVVEDWSYESAIQVISTLFKTIFLYDELVSTYEQDREN